MTDLREAAQMALNDLEALVAYIKGSEPDLVMQVPAIEALRAALAQPEPVLVSPKEFISAVTGKWDIQGIPMLMSVWPVPEKAQPEQEPVGNTLTFMTRAIFNIVADHQEINGGYFIADGDVAAFVDRLAKIINSTFEPLKHKNTAPPQRDDAPAKAVEWQGLTDEEIREFEIWLDDEEEKRGWNPPADIVKYIEAKLKEKNNG